MEYAAVILAIVGFVLGLTSRMKMLLPVVAGLFVVSLGFSIGQGFTFLESALTVMVAQTILQACYFVGLIARALIYSAQNSGSRGAPPPTTAGRNSKVFDMPSKIHRLPRRFAQGIVQGR
jgi:hypothetical protein